MKETVLHEWSHPDIPVLRLPPPGETPQPCDGYHQEPMRGLFGR